MSWSMPPLHGTKIFHFIVIVFVTFTLLVYIGQQRFDRVPWTMSLKSLPVPDETISVYVPWTMGFEPPSFPNATRQYSVKNWRRISMDELLRRFEHKTSENCVQDSEHLKCPPRNRSANPDDLEVKGCPVLSMSQDLDTAIRTYPNHVPLYGEREYIFFWEAELLKRPRLRDLATLPDVDKSRMVALTRGQKVGAECVIGMTLQYRLDIVDGYGRQRTLGMDDVRSWLVNGDKRSTAHVTDLNNGSYHISVPCLWSGLNELRVNVAYPWEYHRAVTDQFRLDIGRSVGIKFQQGAAISYTMCAATPNIPYSCLCNLTSWNKQSFYCGHPAHPKLTCADAVALRNTWFREPVDVTPAESSMMAAMTRKAESSVVKQSQISIVVKEGALPKLQPCDQSPYNLSWSSRSPKGYWKGKQWISLICDNSKYFDKMNACLSDISTWTFGDSNALRIHTQFKALTKCKSASNGTWPNMGHCRNDRINTNVFFYPHEYPLILHPRIDNPINKYGSVADILDKIPSTGRHLVVVHYYLHVQSFHMSTMRSRLEALRDAVSRLLKRNPNVQIALEGPHVIYIDWNVNHAAGGDVLISFLIPLLKEIFEPLANHVLLLDGYDMTVAVENEHMHPELNYAPELVRLVLNYVCGRKQ